jgi:WD40 repeat protein
MWSRSVTSSASGEQRISLTGHTGQVNAVAIAPDGTWLATTGSDGSVRIWDAATGAAGAMIRLDNSADSCAWSPRGESLVVGGHAGIYCFIFKPGPSDVGLADAYVD